MKDKTRRSAPRSYQQKARAESAEASSRRILEAFLKRAEKEWFDKITLDAIAADAGVTVQTVVRKFGGKEGLLDAAQRDMGNAIQTRRAVTPGELDPAVDVLADDYEAVGKLILRLLGQEDLHPVLKPKMDAGRAGHRQWIEEVFAEELAKRTPAKRQAALDALVVATDVYVWKLVRLDMGRPVAAFKQIVKQMILAALASQ
jgi:AcrR family transcriptional regulator